MEKRAKIINDILNAFQETDGCLEKLTDLLDDYPLDGEEEVYDMDEADCLRLCLDIKRACLSFEEIRLGLSEIAKYYNKHFDTDYPLYFQKYIEQHRSTMTEAYTQMLHAMSQIAARSPEGEREGEAEISALPPALLQLYQSASTLNSLTIDILNLCQRTMDKEAQLKTRSKKCLQMLQEAIQEAQENQRGIIQMCLQMGKASACAAKTDDRPLMSEVMKRYKSLEEFAAAQLHQFSMSDINLYVVEKALTEHRLEGLSEEEAEWWKDEPQMAKDVRYVIEHFDELILEMSEKSKKSEKGEKGEKSKIPVKVISMLMQWSHLSRATILCSVPQFFRYFRSIYKGSLQLPSESNYHKYKGKYTEQMYQEFLQKIEQLLQRRKLKAVEVKLKAQSM